MSLRHQESDFSNALTQSGIAGWNQDTKQQPPHRKKSSHLKLNLMSTGEQSAMTLRQVQQQVKDIQGHLLGIAKNRFKKQHENWQWQMSPKQAESKINEIYTELLQHQNEFKQQTRIDSVDVIIRRKDKKLEPLQPPKKNIA